MTFCIAFKFAQICDKTGNSATPWQIFCHFLHFIKTEEAVELAMSPPTSNSVNNPFLFIFILHLAQSCFFFFFCCLLFGNWKTCLHLQGMVTGDAAEIQKLMGENCVQICVSLVISYMGKRFLEFCFYFSLQVIQTVSNLFSHLLSQYETMNYNLDRAPSDWLLQVLPCKIHLQSITHWNRKLLLDMHVSQWLLV